MDLNIVWFLLVGILVVVYAILDGFDLGIGSLFYILGKTDDEKKILINSIGPVWDGNEVWLLTGGGALFAAFPFVYATAFSGFYLAMMLVLFGLILRAVGIEYYFKIDDDKSMQKKMGVMFFIGSFVPALLFGVAFGNVVVGIPLDSLQNYSGTFFGLLNPYSLLLGVVGLVGFLLQGSTYTILKTEGDLQQRAIGLTRTFGWTLLVVWLLGTVATLFFAPYMFNNYNSLPVLYIIPLLTLISIIAVPVFLKKEAYGKVFVASSLAIATKILTLAGGLFPNLIIATNPEQNLTIYNAASSNLTLTVMLIIALIGVPIVLIYTGYVYTVFRGKAKPERSGY